MFLILYMPIDNDKPPGRFEYTGTRDYTPFLALPAALRFIDSRLGGIETMMRYNRSLLCEGSRLVIDRWQSYYVVSLTRTTALQPLNSSHRPTAAYCYPARCQKA